MGYSFPRLPFFQFERPVEIYRNQPEVQGGGQTEVARDLWCLCGLVKMGTGVGLERMRVEGGVSLVLRRESDGPRMVLASACM